MFHEGFKYSHELSEKITKKENIDYNRCILHCDMDNFYASVELLNFPQYKNMPVAVCGNPESRHGIILAKNQIAKKFGINTAETIYSAKNKCKELICLPPNFHKYKKYSHFINKIYLDYTDLIQPFSIDESWLDVTHSQHLFGSGIEIAQKISNRVKSELGLTISIGISFNKIFAKMGSNYKKPDGITLISKENYQSLLWNLKVSKLFFVGKATAKKLNSIGCKTIGQLANTSPDILYNFIGKHGITLYNYANGFDISPVTGFNSKENAKSISNGITFSRNLKGERDLKTGIAILSDKVARRLRTCNLKASGLKIDIKTPQFTTISRQKQFLVPTNSTYKIQLLALEIINAYWDVTKPIRLLSIAGINLVDENANSQLTIDDIIAPKNLKVAQLDSAVDQIRAKYGNDSILIGRTVKTDIIHGKHHDKN